MYRLNNLSNIQIDKEFRIKVECPSVLPDHVKKAKIEVVALKLAVAEGHPSTSHVVADLPILTRCIKHPHTIVNSR